MSLATKYRPKGFAEVYGQENVVNTLVTELKNNVIKQAYLFAGKTGSGKAQPLYSKLLTPNGYITMGEVKVGDEVFGEDGKPHKVLGVFPQGKKPIYELTFSDGSKCRCSDEHLWTVKENNKRALTVKEMLRSNYYKYQIPITAPINFINRCRLPIDAWLLGVLIGCGGYSYGSTSLWITTKDNNLINKVTKALVRYDCTLVKVAKVDYIIVQNHKINRMLNSDAWNTNTLVDRLKKLRVAYSRYGLDSFIPKEYLFSDIDTRMTLLQGLLDSQGKPNCIRLRTNQLTEDIIFLVQSLGGVCRECEKRLCVKLPKDTNVYRTLRSIEYVGEEECQCIYVDNPSHLYLTDNMIVTHNTTMARILANAVDSFVIELDAASNGSVESIKELLNTVKTPPLGYDHTVVILDEIQSISYSAFSVLLKVFELPPEHLIFILCTTEANKVPQPIYNRCEVFEFTNISVETIYKRLKYICIEEQLGHTDEALNMIASLADGSMRQAITYLEQCSSYPITPENLKKVLLADSYDNYLNLVYSILDKNYATVAQLIYDVNNIDKYLSGLFSFVLDINIYVLTKNSKLIDTPEIYTEDFDNFSDKEIAQIKKLRDILLDLQFEGRNNPILKQLLIVALYKFMED